MNGLSSTTLQDLIDFTVGLLKVAMMTAITQLLYRDSTLNSIKESAGHTKQIRHHSS